MQKRKVGIFLALAGIILLFLPLIFSMSNITGFTILNNNFKYPFSNILSIILGSLLLGIGITFAVAESYKRYSLEEIVNDKTSKTFRRGSSRWGKLYLEKGIGKLPPLGTNKEEAREVYKEVYNLIKLELHKERKGDVPGWEDITKRYTRHKINIPELKLNDVISYDARTLSTGNRGVYRYIFDSNGKYLGLVQHVKSQGKYKYGWAH